ncbi:DUF1949 domain-containing protein [Kushneria phosphatilytica]|uniref:DUF1949 domain-containing protein n=2 Tax=Kushneria phosphatilytica TaxID=657387 RepID=A0A5C1A1B3_9GAMM|nr:DUF1949 domain-containing protein [Kushneria phosphatilytica]
MPAVGVDNCHVADIEVNKSRFIGWCAAAKTPEVAQQLVTRARQYYPDASHHCLAFIAGPPGEQQAIGFADDGEPGGTAGRPMYQVLEGSGLGRIACVVTRYFGGTKLGTGGLARAYAQTVSRTLDALPTRLEVPRRKLTLGVDFAAEHLARSWLDEHEGEVLSADYGAEGVLLTIAWPEDGGNDFSELTSRVGGRLSLHDPATS